MPTRLSPPVARDHDRVVAGCLRVVEDAHRVVALFHQVESLLLATGQRDFRLEAAPAQRLAARRRAPAVNSTRCRGPKRRSASLIHTLPSAVSSLRQPQDDLPPERLCCGLEAFHPPMPGRVAGKSHHAAAGLLHDQQRFAVGRLGQHLRRGLQRAEFVGSFQGRQLVPDASAVRTRRPSASGSVARPSGLRRHAFSAGRGNCTSERIGIARPLPLVAVHRDRQHVRQRRVGVAAGPEGVKAAQHHQPGPLLDHRGQRSQLVGREQRGVDVADDVDVVLAPLRRRLSSRPVRCLRIARVEPHDSRP